MRQLSSHNSYDFDDAKGNLQLQLSSGVRSFEFDIHHRGAGHSQWSVYHTSGSGDFCSSLDQCLDQLIRWHRANDHDVITLWLQVAMPTESGWKSGGHRPVDLDEALHRKLGDLIYKPSQLWDRCPSAVTLRNAVERCGWPTVQDLRNKFIVVLHGDNKHLTEYLQDVNGQKSCFVAPEGIDRIDRVDRWPNAVFFNLEIAHSRIAYDLFQTHLIFRAWKARNSRDWTRAIADRVHHIATDRVNRWQLTPRITDRKASFQPIVPR